MPQRINIVFVVPVCVYYLLVLVTQLFSHAHSVTSFYSGCLCFKVLHNCRSNREDMCITSIKPSNECRICMTFYAIFPNNNL